MDDISQSLRGQVTVARLDAEAVDGRVILRWCIPRQFYNRPQRHQVIHQRPEYDRFRIWRREVDNPGGDPPMHHVDHPSPTDDELAFDGPLGSCDGRWYAWTDETVEVGKTYGFYVSGAEGVPAGPVHVKLRDPKIWWTFQQMQAHIDRFLECCPLSAERQTIGYSRLGKSIDALFLGDGEIPVILTAAVHPSETGPELLLGAVEQLLADGNVPAQFRLIVVPCANPDSRDRFARGCPFNIRTNAAGVDLNRNFEDNWSQVSDAYGERSDEPVGDTWRGPAPASEPETRALRDLCEAHPPAAMIAYHWMGGVSAPPMNHHLGIYSWDDWDDRDVAYEKRCQAAANAYGCGFFETAEPEPWYPHPSVQPGTFEGWVHRRFGVPGYAMEGGREDLSRVGNRDAVTPEVMAEFTRRHAQGLAAFLHHLTTQ